MNNIKMSELFDLPVESCICFSDCTAVTVAYSEITESQIKAIDHAINSHDRLVQERDELIKALEEVLGEFQVDASVLGQHCPSYVSRYLELSKEVNGLISKIQGDE